MKKIFIAIAILLISVMMCLMIGCDVQPKPDVQTTEFKSINTDTLYVNGRANYEYEIVELTYHGQTHQYVQFVYHTYGHGAGASLNHWVDCEFCKKNNLNY